MINRTLSLSIKGKIGRGKAIMIIGPRQVGKTTLILRYLEGIDYKFFDGDDPVTRTLLDTPNTETIRSILENKKVVFIDEAQRINNIGLTMKIIVDQFKDVQLWISGSSSFSLFNEVSESLTGRKWEYEMSPVDLRTDIGALWENFLISERIKQNRYKLTLAKSYFWRTTQQQEIDYVEEKGITINAYEFKWNKRRGAKISKTFTKKYNSKGAIISKANFREFVRIE